MNRSTIRLAAAHAACVLGMTFCATLASAADGAIPRTLPPEGIAVDAAVQQQLSMQGADLSKRLATLQTSRELPPDAAADVEVYLKAVRLALHHGEFYAPKDVATAQNLLATAANRVERLAAGERPWQQQRGLVVRGFRSAIDDSAQPYGLVIPEQLSLTKPVPLYVWLHGRGDKTTDLHFIAQRETSVGRIAPEDGIVLHPNGRYCNAFKFAGETDVLEAIEAVARHYPIDRDRIVLWGFSMGGAGAWHLGAHYPDRWVAVSPGAGFAETRRYQNLQPDKYPPAYEQTLWGLYDVPDYVRNLLNVPVIAYSGENDRQIQAARVMEEAYKEHGRTLPHLIGPGMGHAYHPETLKELQAKLQAIAAKGLDRHPSHVSLQTKTLRYNRCHWVSVLGLEQHWEDARIDASASEPGRVRVMTRNVTELELASPWSQSPRWTAGATIDIDGQTLRLPEKELPATLRLVRTGDRWQFVPQAAPVDSLRKRPGLQGPIDDVLFEPFLLVLPSGTARHPQVEAWVQAEQKHFIDRWRALFRGEPRVKTDRDVTTDDIQKYHLIVWGDAVSNSVLARVVDKLPLGWSSEQVAVGDQTYAADRHVPVLIYPNPLNARKYVVVNSGITFREGHDRTNSLQNPKLPDWAVIDITVAPDALQPGKVVAADFFDEAWQLKK